jgi:hypothetical protein
VNKEADGRLLQVAPEQEVRYGARYDDGLGVASVHGLEAVGPVSVEVGRVALPEDHLLAPIPKRSRPERT